MLLKQFHLDVTILLEDMHLNSPSFCGNNSKLYAYLIVYNVDPYIC